MFSKLFVPFALLILFITGCSTNPPAGSNFAKVFGGSYTISASNGGFIKDFKAAAEEVLKNGWHIKIDVKCLSACALFADKARPNVCITENAVFGFHMMTDKRLVRETTYVWKTDSLVVPLDQETLVVIREPMPVSSDIEEWVMKHGGFPYDRYLKMYSKEALAFWPMCK